MGTSKKAGAPAQGGRPSTVGRESMQAAVWCLIVAEMLRSGDRSPLRAARSFLERHPTVRVTADGAALSTIHDADSLRKLFYRAEKARKVAMPLSHLAQRTAPLLPDLERLHAKAKRTG